MKSRLSPRHLLRPPLLVVIAAWALVAADLASTASSKTGTSTRAKGLAQIVNTRVMTGQGNTFPGADAPFGMVQWSPDTKPSYNDGGGYGNSDNKLWGYSLTHVSGPGCRAAGDVPMLPMTGALPAGDPNRVTTVFSHAHELAQAGYYSAQSNEPNTVTSEFTATPHSSMARFSYPATKQADFLIKLMASQNGDYGDSVKVIGNNEIQGSDTSGHFCGETSNDGQSQQYTVYFDIVFDHPFTASQVITNSGQTDPAAVYLTFDTTTERTVQAKVGISYVSAANAKLNWQAENPGWNFNAVRQRAQVSWAHLLAKIQVSGGSYAQTQEFYSLLYKSLLEPSITSDVNGQFMGSDFKIHASRDGQQNQYGMFSGWDTYHSLSQLQAMLDPQAASDMAQSQLNYYGEDKLLQQWGYDYLNNYQMVGDPADAIITDYYTFGARNFDTKRALTDMLAQATTVNDVRPGEALEQRTDTCPRTARTAAATLTGSCRRCSSTTQPIWRSRSSRGHGRPSHRARLTRRANNWENLFDAATGLLTSRLENGQFEPAVTPTARDVPRRRRTVCRGRPLRVSVGCAQRLRRRCSRCWAATPRCGRMLERYLSRPNGSGTYALLSERVRLRRAVRARLRRRSCRHPEGGGQIRNTMYHPGPDRLANNDDLGASSSSYVWEMLGMYPENPGRGTLVFASPGFPQGDDPPRQREGDQHQGTGCVAQHLLREVAEAERQAVLEALGQLQHELAAASRSTGRWVARPTSWGSRLSEAPPSYTPGLRPVVGVASSRQVSLGPASRATARLGAQNATSREQHVRFHLSAPVGSGLSLSPANATISVAPSGRATFPVTVSATKTAPPGTDCVTARVAARGAAPQMVRLAIVVADAGSRPRAIAAAGSPKFTRRPPVPTAC